MVDEATFKVEDAQILFRNFSGEPTTFKKEGGERTFAVVLDPKDAELLIREGWNVKYLSARDEGDEDTPIITITVGFKNFPPNITLLTDSSRTRIGEDLVATLDWANIRQCDLIARAYDWTVGDKSGRKAYLKTMFVTIEEDELERKYALQFGEGM